MIEIWMKYHLACDSNCNTVYNPQKKKNYNKRQIMLGDTILVLVTLRTPWFTIRIEQDK